MNVCYYVYMYYVQNYFMTVACAACLVYVFYKLLVMHALCLYSLGHLTPSIEKKKR